MDKRWASVILSGGQGRRMGCVDKGGLTFDGVLFKERIRRQLLGLKLPCYISRAFYPGLGAQEDGLPVIEDAVTGQDGEWIGPMGGIWSCFNETGFDGLFFVSCDMPLFREQMARILMERWKPGVDAVLWRTRDGRQQPLCGFYSRTCLGAIEACIERRDYRLRSFLAAIRCEVVETGMEHIPDTWFMNVNSPETYRKLNERSVPVLAVSGRKDTGKTTLLAMLVETMHRSGIRCAVIKHDGHDFEADMPGTDSRRLKDAGAMGTVVYSAGKFSMTKDQPSMEAGDFFRFFPEADIILLEGQKYSDYPKLEVLRRDISDISVCSPETVLAYVWSGGEGTGRLPSNYVETESGDTCPVFVSGQRDQLVELVIGFMDHGGACPGDGRKAL